MVTQLAEMAQLPEEQKAAFVVGQQVNSFIFLHYIFHFFYYSGHLNIVYAGLRGRAPGLHPALSFLAPGPGAGHGSALPAKSSKI